MSEKSHRATFCNSRLKALFLALMPPLWLTMSIFPQKPALAQATSRGCPAGTAPGSSNFITNGDFSTLGLTGFSSPLPYRGDNTYPDDPIGGISIQSGSKNYVGGIVIGEPFPGDPVGGANASNNYLYSNPGSASFPNPTVWQQTVSGLQPNKAYRFIAYFYNLLSPSAGGVAPVIVLGIDAFRSAPISVSTKQQWTPVEFSFTTTANQTSATLSIIDQANDAFGDDFGMTALSLNECQSIGAAKSAGTPAANSNGTYTVPYTVTVTNYGSETLSNVQLNDDLTTTFANAAGFTVSNVQIQSQSSGSSLTTNSAYDGRSTNPNLLGANSSLPTGGTATVTFNVTITPGSGAAGLGPFNNSIVATATTPSGGQVSDNSVNGANPDPNGDGNPTNDNSPTPVTLTPVPRVGVAKSVGTPVANPNGTFTVPYTVNVRNYGNEALSNVQLNDDLTTTFANAAGFAVSNVQIQSQSSGSSLTINSAYDGRSTNPNLLGANSSLGIGAAATVTFNVTITPGSGTQGFGPFDNTVRAVATGFGGTQVSDDSVNGTDPDTGGNGTPINSDGDPTNNTSPTRVTFTATPRLGVAKSAGTVINNGDGSFTVPYTLTVRNAGDTALNAVQVTENLSQTFPGASVLTIVPNSLIVSGVGANPTVNTNFNGTTDTNLLAGTDSLAIGASATIRFSVRVNPGTTPGPYNNTAIGNATGTNGTAVSDSSNNGTNDDPDGDGDPSNNNAPTLVSFTSNPRLGVAKSAGSLTSNSDGSFTVPYTITVRNAGDILLNNLQLTENLSQTFNGASAFSVEANSLRVVNGGVTVNPNFNGTSNTDLLTGTDSLAVGANATISFNVRVTPGSKLGTYNNTVIGNARVAIGNAILANGGAVTDQSTDGTNVDPDSDGNPSNNSIPTPVDFSGNLRLLKRITGVTRNGAPINSISFTGVEADTDANAMVQAGLNPIGLRTIPEANSLASGDEVEYTIYLLSDGLQATNNVNFCDLIPTGTTYIPNSTVVQIGNTQLTSSNQFIPSLTPMPAGNSCLEQNNPNGAVIVNLGNIPNTSGNNFGFVRLRVKIN